MSCPFTIFVNNDNEFQANKYPAHVTDEALKKLETALKKPDKKPSRFVRKFNLSSDNPIRYSYWPRLLKVEDKAVELKYKPTQEEEKLDFSCLLEKSGYEFTDAKLINNYKLNDDGVKAVRLTLHELHQQKPELVYCPELWNLCAMFMHYHGKELTMKCLNAVLSKENWISSTKDEWKAKTLSLGYYTTKSKKIGNIDYFTPFNGWIKAVWDLPFDILLLLIDSFLIEGYKVFYRAALILAIESSRKNQGEILFNTIPKEIDYPPIYFRDTIFSIRGMSRKKIQKCIGLASDFLKTKSAAFDYLVTPSVRGNELTHSNAIEAVSNTVIKTDGSKKIVQNVAYKILTPKEITDIIYHIEDENIKKVCKPNLVYASDNDGVSLNTLLKKTPNNESLIVVEVDTKPEKAVVGAFLYNRLEKKDGFYGSGKSFVFRSRPENLEVFKWNKNDEKNRFQRVTNECIEIGGGKEAHSPAIDLNDSLSLLKSGPSDVFDSPSLLYGLVKENDVKFDKEETANAKIIRVELFSFVQM